jgi:hypothetical protein
MEIAAAESDAAENRNDCKMNLLSCFTSNAPLDWFIEQQFVFHIFNMA